MRTDTMPITTVRPSRWALSSPYHHSLILTRPPLLQYEIRSNPNIVDLLVSLAHVAASDGVLKEPLPVDMGLRVPLPKLTGTVSVLQPVAYGRTGAEEPLGPPRDLPEGLDGGVEFDELASVQMRASIVQMIKTLPPVRFAEFFILSLRYSCC